MTVAGRDRRRCVSLPRYGHSDSSCRSLDELPVFDDWLVEKSTWFLFGGVLQRPPNRNCCGVGIAKTGCFGFLEAGEGAGCHGKRCMHGGGDLYGRRQILFRG